MTIISVDRHQLEMIAIEGGTSDEKLNLVSGRVVMRVDRNDFDTRLAVGLHEETSVNVEEDFADLREGDGVDRTEAIRLQEFANKVACHHGVTDVEDQKSFETQIYRYAIYFRRKVRTVWIEISRLKLLRQ